MSEELTKPRTLTSDPKVLHKIKAYQFKRQMLPLALVIILMVINVIRPLNLLLYPTLFGFAWYLARQGETDMNAWLNNTNKTEIVSKVSISYIRAMGQPAATYIFQTENPQMVIIWAEAVN